MPTRICPKCKSDLGSNDYYFCSSCGAALSANLVQVPSLIKVSRYIPSETHTSKLVHKGLKQVSKKVGRYITKKNVFLTFVALLILTNVALVTVLLLRPYAFSSLSGIGNFYVTEDKKVSLAIPNTLDLGLDIPSQTFGSNNITSYIPKDAEFYLEAYGYSVLMEKYLPINVPYKDLIEESTALVNDHFAVFAVKKNAKWEWTGVFIPKDVEEVNQRLEELNEDKLSFRVIDDKLIVTTDPEIITAIEEAKNQKAMNLSLSPAYASAKAKLPKDGQILVMFLSPRSNEVLTQIRNNLATRLVKNALAQISGSGYNEFVVRKD